MQRRPMWIRASAEARTWSRFYLAVFTQTLQFLNILLLKFIYCAAVLSCETWSCRGETAVLLSNTGVEKSKVNLSCGNSQVSFPLFNVWGRRMLNSYTPFLCYCSAAAAGRGVWTTLVSERRMWRKSKGDVILTINLTEEVPPAFQEDKKLT